MRTYLSLVLLAAVVSGCAGKNSGCSHKDKRKCNDTQMASGAGSSSGALGDIRIVTAEPDPRVCEYIDDAMGYSKANSLADAQSQARQMIKRNAKNMGGNIVRLDTSTIDDPGMVERGQVVLNGRVFKCDMTIDPQAVLGKVDESIPRRQGSVVYSDSGPQGGASGASGQGSAGGSRAGTGSGGLGGLGNALSGGARTNTGAQGTQAAQTTAAAQGGGSAATRTNPPPQPQGSFNEQAFLNSGEDEFEG